MLTPWKFLLCQMALDISYHIAKASLCLGGQDIFAAVRENSPLGAFVANLSITGDPGASSIRLCLTGENADWFFLEGRTVRLNASHVRALDREIQGSVLMAALACYEDETIQSVNRITVEILNENDNRPGFLPDSIQPRYINELTPLNAEVFRVKAKDADGDTIIYVIDKSLPDAHFFRIDLPNSGKVILNHPLDYETQTLLQVSIYAVEMNTKEKYNTTATITIHVMDGDDQYPQFLPCSPVYEDKNTTICTNPVYTVNITEQDQRSLLHFSPGPIYAEDGDRDLRTPLIYSILAGDDAGRFIINHETGEVTITRRVENRLITPSFRLRIMAAQVNDLKKYTVATAIVHVVARNRFLPRFNKTLYKGFLIESSSPATLVSTYGNQLLLLQATDRDFRNGVNPKLRYVLRPMDSKNKLFHITQEGVLIAKTNLLRAFERHILEVVATDQESGDVASASVDIEVLQRDQPVPRGPFGEEALFGELNVGMASGVAVVALLLALAALLLLIRLARRCRERQDPAERGSVDLGKHPNVVSAGRPVPLIEEASYHNEAFANYETSRSSSLCGRRGIYTKMSELPSQYRRSSSSKEAERTAPLGDMLPILVIPEPRPKDASVSVMTNGKGPERALSSLGESAEEIVEGAPAREDQGNPLEEEQLEEDRKAEATVDIMMPFSEDVLAVSSAEQTDAGSDEEEPEAEQSLVQVQSSKPKISFALGDGKKTRSDEEEAEEGVLVNPYASMHAVICVSDEEDTTAEDETIKEGRYEKRRQAKVKRAKKKTIETDSPTSSSSKASESLATKSPAGPQSGVFYFVEDSVEF